MMAMAQAREHRVRPSGFTLIEVLVALVIFAMLALAGVTLLRNAASGQAQTRMHPDAQATLLHSQRLMEQDLAQAVLRGGRTDAGLLAPVFFGRPAQGAWPIMEFVRGGISNPDGDPRPDLKRVEYWLRDGGTLERRTYPQLDGSEAEEFVLLLDKVSALEVAYRNAQDDWLLSWDGQAALTLPAAVRLTITRAGGAPLTMMFLVNPVTSGAKPVTDMR
jgi:general secretion pathway protein J